MQYSCAQTACNENYVSAEVAALKRYANKTAPLQIGPNDWVPTSEPYKSGRQIDSDKSTCYKMTRSMWLPIKFRTPDIRSLYKTAPVKTTSFKNDPQQYSIHQNGFRQN